MNPTTHLIAATLGALIALRLRTTPLGWWITAQISRHRQR